MSIGNTMASSAINSAMPLMMSSFRAPPVAPEVGLRGATADELIRAETAEAWQMVLPPVLMLSGLIVGGFAAYALWKRD